MGIWGGSDAYCVLVILKRVMSGSKCLEKARRQIVLLVGNDVRVVSCRAGDDNGSLTDDDRRITD